MTTGSLSDIRSTTRLFERWHAKQSGSFPNEEVRTAAERCLLHVKAWRLNRWIVPDVMRKGAAEDFARLSEELAKIGGHHMNAELEEG